MNHLVPHLLENNREYMSLVILEGKVEVDGSLDRGLHKRPSLEYLARIGLLSTHPQISPPQLKLETFTSTLLSPTHVSLLSLYYPYSLYNAGLIPLLLLEDCFSSALSSHLATSFESRNKRAEPKNAEITSCSLSAQNILYRRLGVEEHKTTWLRVHARPLTKHPQNSNISLRHRVLNPCPKLSTPVEPSTHDHRRSKSK
jgi:hypothetical protein